MSSLPSIETAIRAKLTGASAVTNVVGTRIYVLQAPSGTALPYIVFYLASGLMPNTTPRDDINDVWRVECLTNNGDTAFSLANAVYGALHESALTVSGWSNYWLAFERRQQFVDNVNATQTWRQVHDYRVKLSATS